MSVIILFGYCTERSTDYLLPLLTGNWMYKNHKGKKWRLYEWKFRVKVIPWKEACILLWFVYCSSNATSFWRRKFSFFFRIKAGTRGCFMQCIMLPEYVFDLSTLILFVKEKKLLELNIEQHRDYSFILIWVQQIATRMVIQYGWGPDDSPAIYYHSNAVFSFL